MSEHYKAYPSFSDKELACQHCGKFNEKEEFNELMEKVQELRDEYGKGIPVTSAYRCESHPIEAAKQRAGYHSIAAIDLGVSGTDAYRILELAFKLGFTGIGVNQKGGSRFIHLDRREVPTVWSY